MGLYLYTKYVPQLFPARISHFIHSYFQHYQSLYSYFQYNQSLYSLIFSVLVVTLFTHIFSPSSHFIHSYFQSQQSLYSLIFSVLVVTLCTHIFTIISHFIHSDVHYYQSLYSLRSAVLLVTLFNHIFSHISHFIHSHFHYYQSLYSVRFSVLLVTLFTLFTQYFPSNIELSSSSQSSLLTVWKAMCFSCQFVCFQCSGLFCENSVTRFLNSWDLSSKNWMMKQLMCASFPSRQCIHYNKEIGNKNKNTNY